MVGKVTLISMKKQRRLVALGFGSILLTGAAHAQDARIPGKMALIQYNADLHFADSATNLRKLREFAEDAVKDGANIVVFPEGSIQGYASATETWCTGNQTSCADHRCRDIGTAAEAVPGGTVSNLWAAFAREHQIYIIFNQPEVDQGVYYNTSAVMGPRGFVAKYRKRELYYIDRCYARAGTTPTLFDTPYGKFGLLICADANSLSKFTAYREAGAHAVVVPMDWDQSPTRRPAIEFFAEQAANAQVDVYAADVSPWDGTGKYRATGGPRERNGLATLAAGVDGISTHALNYR